MEHQHPSEAQMLDAFELFLYACRYRDEQLVVILDPGLPLESIIEDLRVLHLAQIRCVVVCRNYGGLQEVIATLHQRGLAATFLSWTAETTAHACRGVLSQGEMPVVAIDREHIEKSSLLHSEGFRLARQFDAAKVFLLTEHDGLKVDGSIKRIASLSDLIGIRRRGNITNLSEETMSSLEEQLSSEDRDIVVLRGESSSLFQELFTHEGCGTLFTRHSPNLIRQAEIGDVLDIAMLIKPYVRNGSILPISEDEIADTIEYFFVHTVSGAVVAAARLIGFDESAELGKFCTLPRYQRRGLANELAEKMIEFARKEGRKRLFALSTSSYMWQFFKGLGFEEAPREQLPATWKERYDFRRPSKALVMELTEKD